MFKSSALCAALVLASLPAITASAAPRQGETVAQCKESCETRYSTSGFTGRAAQNRADNKAVCITSCDAPVVSTPPAAATPAVADPPPTKARSSAPASPVPAPAIPAPPVAGPPPAKARSSAPVSPAPAPLTPATPLPTPPLPSRPSGSDTTAKILKCQIEYCAQAINNCYRAGKSDTVCDIMKSRCRNDCNDPTIYNSVD